ncbi:hypothetical protein F4782DRAFT_490696 [Xylaria castorea]|nr:hypothetical protein F4782DRAFT_490696 [Xylaria castorea]
MKFATPLAFLLQAIATLAAPAVSLQESTNLAANTGLPNDTTPETSGGPPSWHLDCGSPGITNMCSASNSGAHCDPITGVLTIILEGTCGGCKCISSDQCTGRCG